MVSAYPRRIMGVETEFAIAAYDGADPVLNPEEVSRYLFRPVVGKYRSSNVFIENGSRLYLDVGAHPEYATAECDSLTQLLSYDKAGERIYDDLARQASEALAKDGYDCSVYLFKNNVDSQGNSYGAHENYLISRELVLKSFSERLLPYLITRQLICGAGMINDGAFVVSQRADQVWEGVSSATTRTRPIINTRDEPHGDSRKFRRMHVIVGDSNMAEPTFALKVGSMLLLLEMLEADFDLPDLQVEDPISHIRDISHDLTGQTTLNLVGGGTITALEVQQATLEAAKRWLEVRPDEGTPNEELARVCDLWERTLRAIELQDFSGVSQEIDWVIKLNLLAQFKAKLGCDWDHPKLKQIDLTYHDINPQRSLFYYLQSKSMVQRWTTDDAIDAARTTPPPTTRAALRGRFLEAVRPTELGHNVDWVNVKVNRPEPRTVELLDPFANEDERIDELIEFIRVNSEEG